MSPWWGYRALSGRVRRLPTLVSVHTGTGVIIPILGLIDVAVFLDIAAALRHMAATKAKPAVHAAVREEVWNELLFRRRIRNLVQNLCSESGDKWYSCVTRMGTVVLNVGDTALFTFTRWPLDEDANNFDPLTIFFYDPFLLTAF